MQRTILELQKLQGLLPPRPQDAHKNQFGHVWIIGGDCGMSGAVRMAAETALRSGAGLVSVATHPEHTAYVNIGRPEIMSHGIQNPDRLAELIRNATVLVIGPGLTNSVWSQHIINSVKNSTLPKVIDAGALDHIAEFELTQTVCTPHPGEAARILKCSTQDIQQNRTHAINTLVQWPATWILKGHETLIQTKQALVQCAYGNPGMASAGMGDVLSGLIGALLAQGLSTHDAACLGVAAHAYAGDLAAKEKGQRGLLATDLLPFIRALLNEPT